MTIKGEQDRSAEDIYWDAKVVVFCFAAAHVVSLLMWLFA